MANANPSGEGVQRRQTSAMTRMQRTQTGGGSVIDHQQQAAPQVNSTAKTLQPYICGGSAAILAAVAIHPIDLVKVQIQIAGQKDPMARPGFFNIASKVVESKGVGGLYAGISAAVYRQMVYGTARLGLHRAVSNRIRESRAASGQDAALPVWQKSAVATCTGAVAAFMGCPLDLTLVRMQADAALAAGSPDRRNYKGVLDALGQTARKEGPTALWRGSLPLIARGAAMNLGMMACYDEVKEQITARLGSGMQTNLLAAAASGFMCAFTSLPFDLMKSRLMNMRPDPASGKLPYTGILDCASQIVTKEGPLALWRGYFVYYTRCAPNSMICLLAIEQLNAIYERNLLTPQ
eukprot:g6064.t1